MTAPKHVTATSPPQNPSFYRVEVEESLGAVVLRVIKVYQRGGTIRGIATVNLDIESALDLIAALSEETENAAKEIKRMKGQ